MSVRGGRFLPRAGLPLLPQRVHAALVFLGLWERRAAAAAFQPADLTTGRGCNARAAVRSDTAKAPRQSWAGSAGT